MKKIVVAILLLTVILGASGCVSNSLNDTEVVEEMPFPYTLPLWVTWGMKEGEVRQCIDENETIFEYGDLIYYEYDDDDRNCDVREFYGFTKDNTLIHMSYRLKHPYVVLDAKPNEYYAIYIEIKERLAEKYGEPSGETEEWKNERYKNDEYMRYKAIEEGDYTAMAAWDLEGYICYVELDKGVKVSYDSKKE